ncbi:hypothetical protein U9M48_002227 [Paspalum notatum var. saurae]|uniref:GTD-binding domain-containing protein n=1 Tax=Paspalum notatum var. saurae TaxID=547442 RepID=A0AAQ3PQ18_PASNO
MPGSSPGCCSADPDDACPLCGTPFSPSLSLAAPSRVALAQRRAGPPPADASSSAPPSPSPSPSAALLRDALARQRRALAALQAELEAERGAAAGAACEAMSMILRLQREKAEAAMDARQQRRYAEARAARDAAEAAALRGALDRRGAAVRALAARLRECQARLLRLGYPAPDCPDADPALCYGYEYGYDDSSDEDGGGGLDVGTPRTHHLLNSRDPSSPDAGIEPVVLFGSSACPRVVALADEFPLFADHRGAPGGDEGSDSDDRVYTVDAVHGVPVVAPPEDACYYGPGGWAAQGEDEEMEKLKARLRALEADRESMRHAIMSMGDEKAQVVLLREIAQQLCRDTAVPFTAAPLKAQPRLQPVVAPQRKLVKMQPCFVKVFVITVIKSNEYSGSVETMKSFPYYILWVMSIFCWRRKSNRIRYPIGMCGSNVGLMLVLDRFPKQRQKKIPTRKLGTSIL